MNGESENISVTLDRRTGLLIDCWRRQQPLIPSRREAVRRLVRQALMTRDLMPSMVRPAPTGETGVTP
jgi:hypothetical protein